jgi:tRNA pseudouridine55 synthase
LDGVIVVDKPRDWTSHDAVARMRRLAETREVGHLGTLDPMATGVLPLVIGRATRLSRFYARSEKVYEAEIRFGFSTDSYDSDGVATSPETEPDLDAAAVEEALASFRGTFLQMPPPVSAKKLSGVPAYKLAREKALAELKPVEVHVEEAALLGVEGAVARVRVRCSAGTYVRAIAHELGKALGCGAHVKALRRTQSGEFSIDAARPLPALEELASRGALDEALVPAARLMPDIPSEYVDELNEAHIRHGRDFPVSPFRVQRGSRYVKAVNRAGQLIAVGEIKLPNLYHPFVVL